MRDIDKKFMGEALKEAKKAYIKEEVPVGSVIVKDNKIIARAHNCMESLVDSTAHAEIIAIRKASKKLKNWRLLDATLYVTVEPCKMCKSALSQARVKKIIFGCKRPKQKTKWDFNLNNSIYGNILEDECKNIIKNFFLERR